MEQINKLIKFDDYAEIIQNYAYVALKKLKQPPEYNLDDLFQEGAIVFLEAKNRFKYDRNCSFKSFLILLLKQHFSTIVMSSYKNKKDISLTTLEFDNKNFEISGGAYDALTVVSMVHILADFSSDELDYIKTILLFVDQSTKYRRKLTRNALKISYEREVELRNSIYSKMKK